MLTFFSIFLAAFCVAFGIRRRREDRKTESWALFGSSFVFLITAIVFGPRSPYEIVKTVGEMVMPVGLVWSLNFLLVCLAIAFDRYRNALGVFVLWLLFGLAGNGMVGGWLTHTLEKQYVGIDPFDEEYDVVHVLGGGTSSRQSYTFLGDAGDRVALGARLYHSGNTPLLLTTGSTHPGAGGFHDSANATRQIWESLAVPPFAIIVRPDAHDTEDEMRLLADLAEENQWGHIGIVSSARHLPRVMTFAEQYGVSARPLPANFSGSFGYSGMRSLIPSGGGFRATRNAFKEYLGRWTRL